MAQINKYNFIKCLSDNKGLVRRLIERDVKGKYKGSALGMLWSVITPILMLIIYTFVFSVVFKAKWSVESDSKVEFALILFIGLLVFNLFAECISRSTTIVVSNSNYVKKVVFPLEILPWIVLGGSYFNFFIGIIVWVIAYTIFMGFPQWEAVLFPVILFPLTLTIMGLSWLLAALGVYIRDLSLIVGISLQILMFMSPIFYPITALPEKYRAILYFNPITVYIEMMRDVLYWGKLPSLEYLVISSVVAYLIAKIGFVFFQNAKRGFADVV